MTDGQTDGRTQGESNSSAGLRPVELKMEKIHQFDPQCVSLAKKLTQNE